MAMRARALVLIAYATTVVSVVDKPHGGGRCKTDLDCQLNGECVDTSCRCDAAWTGLNCSYLNTRPSAGSALRQANASTWGGRAIFDAASSKWHLFASEFGGTCGMQMWYNTSHVVHGVADSPNPRGGFHRTGVAVPQYAHCVDPIRATDTSGRDTWILFHNGDGTPGGVCPGGHPGCGDPPQNDTQWVADCSRQGNGSTPAGTIPGRAAPREPSGYGGRSNGVHVSTSGPLGPWLPPADSATQGYRYGDCPAVHALHNGTIVVWEQGIYPPGSPFGGIPPMQVSQRWGEGFETYMPTIDFPPFLVQRAREVEGAALKLDDPTIWTDRRGNWHALMHNGDGPFPCGDPGPLGLAFRDGNPNPVGCTAHLYSQDGRHWIMSPVAAANATVVFDNGRRFDGFRERPKVVLSQHGDLLALYHGVMVCGEAQYPGYPGDGHCIPQDVPPEPAGHVRSASGIGGVEITAPPNEDYSWTVVVPLATDTS